MIITLYTIILRYCELIGGKKIVREFRKIVMPPAPYYYYVIVKKIVFL